MLGKRVLVRTYSAGVHYGTLTDFNGTQVTLEQSRRVWYWKGAFTLNELSLTGPGDGSRISKPVDAITLTQAIEIIPCEEAAIETFNSIKADE